MKTKLIRQYFKGEGAEVRRHSQCYPPDAWRIALDEILSWWPISSEGESESSFVRWLIDMDIFPYDVRLLNDLMVYILTNTITQGTAR